MQHCRIRAFVGPPIDSGRSVAVENYALPATLQNGAVTIGNFDGVHLGHQALVAEVARQARAVQGPVVAVTFSPHPMQILKPTGFPPESSRS